MNSILENYYNYLLDLDITNYKLYSILLRNYLRNSEKRENISDDDLYKFARVEYDKKYLDEDKKEELNKNYKKNLHDFKEDDNKLIPALLGRIYVLTDFTTSSDKLNLDNMLRIDSYFDNYFKCLEKVCIGYELMHINKFDITNDGDKLSLKLSNK